MGSPATIFLVFMVLGFTLIMAWWLAGRMFDEG